jgi:hypothetical protein
MQIDRAIQYLNRALLASRDRELSELEVLVLTGIWEDRSYGDLSATSSYEPTTIRNAASKLFQDIIKITDETITKKNCKSAIVRLVNRNIVNIDLADAPTDVRPFCGRITEIELLTEWIEIDRCKLVAIMGIGGIGKTAIAAKLGDNLASSFEFTIWRSLREAPPLSQLITELVQFLSRFTEIELPAQIDRQILTLLNYLRQHRCLVILDNIEAIMDAGKYAGNYRHNYQDYGILLQTLGTTPHQSCILITSRETPPEINELAAPESPVRALLLEGLDRDAVDLLDRMGLTGEAAQIDRIVANCQGNPLYLRIIANTIFYNFKGNIEDFLNSDRYAYSKIANIIKAQFDRLSTAERLIIYYLSTHREPMTIEAIETFLQPVRYNLSIAQTLVSLSQRSLVQITREGRYTLQNVVMEFVTDEAIEEIVTELKDTKDAFFLKI